MNDSPIVSVIVPCFNLAEYLTDAVESVRSQSFADWECIIVNDGSEDNTEEVSHDLIKADPRIKYFKKENEGLAAARNFGIQQANGKYILPLDADDKIGNEYIERAITAIRENDEVVLVYADAELFGDETGKWNLPEFEISLLAEINMIFCTALFRRSDWEKAGGYDVNMRFGWEDWELWINLLKNGGQVIKLPYCGFFYRVRNNSMLRSISAEQKNKMDGYISQKHCDFINMKLGNPIFLHNELKRYKSTMEYITTRRTYKFYKKIKLLFQ